MPVSNPKGTDGAALASVWTSDRGDYLDTYPYAYQDAAQ